MKGEPYYRGSIAAENALRAGLITEDQLVDPTPELIAKWEKDIELAIGDESPRITREEWEHYKAEQAAKGEPI